MSMKTTIARGEAFHVFEQALDNTAIYLEFEEVELDLAIRRNGRSMVKLTIPIQEWRQIITGWMQTEWASDKRRDYSPINISKAQFDNFLNKFRDKHPEVFNNDLEDQSE